MPAVLDLVGVEARLCAPGAVDSKIAAKEHAAESELEVLPCVAVGTGRNHPVGRSGPKHLTLIGNLVNIQGSCLLFLKPFIRLLPLELDIGREILTERHVDVHLRKVELHLQTEDFLKQVNAQKEFRRRRHIRGRG